MTFNYRKISHKRRSRSNIDTFSQLEIRELLTVNVISDGGTGNSSFLGMSEDGRYSLFLTVAPGSDFNSSISDSNNKKDLFLYDKISDSFTLISHQAGVATTTSNGEVSNARISADGNYVVFDSTASNLVTGQSSGSSPNVFLYSRSSGESVLVSHSSTSSTTPANSWSKIEGVSSAISSDGKYVVFVTNSTNVRTNVVDTNAITDIYLYNRDTGSNTLVSATAGSNSNVALGADAALVSDNAHKIVFNYGTNSASLWDLTNNSVASFSSTATSLKSGGGAISGDGEWVAYTWPWGIGTTSSIFLKSTTTSAVYDITRNESTNAQANGISGDVSISRDGRFVSFSTMSTNLISSVTDANYANDIYVYDRDASTQKLRLVTFAVNSPNTAGTLGSTLTGPIGSYQSFLSSNGRYIFYTSTASNLIANQSNGTGKAIFRYDVVQRVNSLLSLRSGYQSEEANGEARLTDSLALLDNIRVSDVSGDYFGFTSDSTNIVSPWQSTNYDDAILSTTGIGDKIGRWFTGQFRHDVNDDQIEDSWRDTAYGYGATTDVPVIGDWDGDGFDEVGVYRNASWYLDGNANSWWDGTSGGDIFFNFGTSGDIPIVGNWNNDPSLPAGDEIGIYRNGAWYLDYNHNFQWDGPTTDRLYYYGNTSGDVPVIGDWNGDSIDDFGVFRSGYWYLDLDGDHVLESVIDGDAVASFGTAGDIPIVGDWNRDGYSNLGVVRSTSWYLDVNGSRVWDGNGSGDYLFTYGSSGDTPLVGKWKMTFPESWYSESLLEGGEEESSSLSFLSQSQSTSVFSSDSESTVINSLPTQISSHSNSKRAGNGSLESSVSDKTQHKGIRRSDKKSNRASSDSKTFDAIFTEVTSGVLSLS